MRRCAHCRDRLAADQSAFCIPCQQALEASAALLDECCCNCNMTYLYDPDPEESQRLGLCYNCRKDLDTSLTRVQIRALVRALKARR
jgi:hypothetical protein